MTAVSPLDVRPRSHVPAADTTDLSRTTARVLVGGGLLGAVAALALLLDRIALLENPEFVPACSINAVLSCTSVMTSAQSEVFGFPNPVVGVAAFPVVLTLGLLAVSGSGLPRWAWGALPLVHGRLDGHHPDLLVRHAAHAACRAGVAGPAAGAPAVRAHLPRRDPHGVAAGRRGAGRPALRAPGRHDVTAFDVVAFVRAEWLLAVAALLLVALIDRTVVARRDDSAVRRAAPGATPSPWERGEGP